MITINVHNVIIEIMEINWAFYQGWIKIQIDYSPLIECSLSIGTVTFII